MKRCCPICGELLLVNSNTATCANPKCIKDTAPNHYWEITSGVFYEDGKVCNSLKDCSDSLKMAVTSYNKRCISLNPSKQLKKETEEIEYRAINLFVVILVIQICKAADTNGRILLSSKNILLYYKKKLIESKILDVLNKYLTLRVIAKLVVAKDIDIYSSVNASTHLVNIIDSNELCSQRIFNSIFKFVHNRAYTLAKMLYNQQEVHKFTLSNQPQYE